jgi:hypothetical protein
VSSRPIEVVPATPARWGDVLAVLGAGGEQGCYCQAPRGFDTAATRAAVGGRRELLRQQLAWDPPPGMLAYVDGEVAGWCGFGVRGSLPRLDHSRTIPALDDRPVWAILCFNIRVGYRRRGVAAALLDGVVAYARASRAPGLEAYPIDPEGGRVDSSFGYVGITTMFEKAGFRRLLQTDARSDRRPRWLYRLDFAQAAAPAPGSEG